MDGNVDMDSPEKRAVETENLNQVQLGKLKEGVNLMYQRAAEDIQTINLPGNECNRIPEVIIPPLAIVNNDVKEVAGGGSSSGVAGLHPGWQVFIRGLSYPFHGGICGMPPHYLSFQIEAEGGV